jgi:hypothetical protein
MTKPLVQDDLAQGVFMIALKPFSRVPILRGASRAMGVG